MLDLFIMINKDTTYLLIVAILIFVSIILIIYNIYEPLSETKFLINTYLYVYVGYLITILFSLLIYKFSLFNNVNWSMISIYAILGLFTLVLLVLLPKNQLYLKHLLLLIFLICVTICLYKWFYTTYENNVLLLSVAIYTVITFVLLWFAFSDKLDDFDEWNPYIIILLIIALIIILANTFLNINLFSFTHIFAFMSIFLISGLLLYDVTRVRSRYKLILSNCKSKTQLECVDYINNSLGFSIDFIVIILDLLDIKRDTV